jgi:hypothetical protein
VFQKAFVEFFVRKDEMERIRSRMSDKADAPISMYASNKQVSRTPLERSNRS